MRKLAVCGLLAAGTVLAASNADAMLTSNGIGMNDSQSQGLAYTGIQLDGVSADEALILESIELDDGRLITPVSE